MKIIKNGEYYEPRIGEIFMYEGKKVMCVRGTPEESACHTCCLLSKGCGLIPCGGYARTDKTFVRFIELHKDEKQYQIIVNGESINEKYIASDNINRIFDELKSCGTLKAGDNIEIQEIKTMYSEIFKDTNERINSYEKALQYVGKQDTRCIDTGKFAIVKLLVIAEAWNKADGFVIDVNDNRQCKWFPSFNVLNKKCVFVEALAMQPNVALNLGSKLSFKTRERAKQFGTQFIDLWNAFLLDKQ